MIRDTSRQSYVSVIPTLNARQTTVLELLRSSQTALTNREIAAKLGWEINTVTPRTNELVGYGLIHEAGTRRDPKTGRKAHAWAVGAPPKPKPRIVGWDTSTGVARPIYSQGD